MAADVSIAAADGASGVACVLDGSQDRSQRPIVKTAPTRDRLFPRPFETGIVVSMKARSSLRAEPDYDELVALVRDLPRGRVGQIVNSKLYVSTTCDPAHAHTLAEMSATLLAGAPDGDPVPSGWTFLTEVELVLPGQTLVTADIAGWRAPHERIGALPLPIGLVPQWVCEVLDPGTRSLDLTSKRQIYALSGVQNLWIVDPHARVLEVYENHRGRWLLAEAVGEDVIAAPPFDDLHFDVGDLWMPLPPPPRQPHRPS